MDYMSHIAVEAHNLNTVTNFQFADLLRTREWGLPARWGLLSIRGKPFVLPVPYRTLFTADGFVTLGLA